MTEAHVSVEAWVHFVGDLETQAILDSLAHVGLLVRTPGTTAPSIPGLVLFREPGADLVRFLRESSLHGPMPFIAVACGVALTDENVWDLVGAGAADVVTWDGTPQATLHLAERLHRWTEVERLLESGSVRVMAGRSRAWRATLRQVVEVARFSQASILTLGESGTGKELLARLIHDLDTRPNKGRLVILDCTTIVPELSGSEFFGHERGAFTGAASARDGAFAEAAGGTLFLDEVGELPLVLQAQLLRVVQEHNYKRVGSNTWRQTNFRLVCATNRDLRECMARGEFRSDLYYRIADCVVWLPALRDRVEDVLPLARHFLAQMYDGSDVPPLDDAVRRYLASRQYPGNVRELRQLVRRVAQRHVGCGPITVGDLPEGERPVVCESGWRNQRFDEAIRLALDSGASLKDISNAACQAAIRIAIADEEGSLQRAARRLQVTDRALQLRRAQERLAV